MQECVFLISCVFKTLVKTCTLPRVRAPTMWFPESLMTTMQVGSTVAGTASVCVKSHRHRRNYYYIRQSIYRPLNACHKMASFLIFSYYRTDAESASMAGSNSLQPNGIDSLSAANGMNDTKALHLAPVPDSMLIGEAGPGPCCLAHHRSGSERTT